MAHRTQRKNHLHQIKEPDAHHKHHNKPTTKQNNQTKKAKEYRGRVGILCSAGFCCWGWVWGGVFGLVCVVVVGGVSIISSSV